MTTGFDVAFWPNPLDALAKVELERQIIDPAPGRGQRGFVLEAFRIAVDQLIPNHPRQDDALAVGVEVRRTQLPRKEKPVMLSPVCAMLRIKP